MFLDYHNLPNILTCFENLHCQHKQNYPLKSFISILTRSDSKTSRSHLRRGGSAGNDDFSVFHECFFLCLSMIRPRRHSTRRQKESRWLRQAMQVSARLFCWRNCWCYRKIIKVTRKWVSSGKISDPEKEQKLHNLRAFNSSSFRMDKDKKVAKINERHWHLERLSGARTATASLAMIKLEFLAPPRKCRVHLMHKQTLQTDGLTQNFMVQKRRNLPEIDFSLSHSLATKVRRRFSWLSSVEAASRSW